MPPPRSLLQRLLLFTLPVEALVLLLFGTWLVHGMEKRNLALADQRLKALQGDWLRRTSFDERGGLTGEMDPTVLPPDLRGCLLDGNGAVVWESPSGWFRDSGLRPSSREGLSVLATGYLDGAPARILRTGLRMRRPEDPALTATGPFVEAFLAQPLGPLLEADRRFRLQAVAVGGGLLLLTAVLLWTAVAWGLAPVRRLVRRLDGIPGPSGAERIPESGVPEELKPMAQAVNGLLDRLWALLEIEQRRTVEMAHDLRTPVTLVKSTLQTSLLTARGEQDLRVSLEEALEDLERLEATAETLLARTRPPDPGASLRAFEPVELAGLLRDVARRMGAAARAAGLDIVVDDLPCRIHGDRSSLERLFVNLTDNALKYCRSRKPVVLRCGAEEGRFWAAVEDGGPTVSAEDRPRLFHPFIRGEKGTQGRQAGAGLGLSIALEIARLHGADLDWEETDQGGNRFVVRFPLSRPPAK